MGVLATYISVACFALVPMGTALLARANGMGVAMSWLLAGGPIVGGFLAYFLTVTLKGRFLDWTALGPLLLSLVFVFNFWQARKLVRGLPGRVS